MGVLTKLPDNSYEYRDTDYYGNDYDWGCVVVPHGTIAEIRLAPSRPPDRHELEQTLIDAGFEGGYWKRADGRRTPAFTLERAGPMRQYYLVRAVEDTERGSIAWGLWGGDAGRAWAKRELEKRENN